MTSKQTSTDVAVEASVAEVAEVAAPSHDRAVTPVGAGRIQFKGHAAKAGYPFRVWDGRVQGFVDGAWMDAEDAAVVE